MPWMVGGFRTVHAGAAGRGKAPASSGRRRTLTVGELCAELQVSRSTFYEWRQKGRAPRCLRLPNGALRIRRDDLEDWLNDCETCA